MDAAAVLGGQNQPVPQASKSSTSLKRTQSNMSERGPKDISTAELVNYKRLFDTFDVDGSGYLSFDELKYMLLCLGISLDDEAIDQLKEEFDDDGNGTLDFDEFVTLMQLADLQSRRTISDAEERKHIMTTKSKRFAHNTWQRMSWDILILTVSFYYFLRCVYEYYETDKLDGLSLAFEIILTIIALLDVGIYANSGYQDENGKNVDDLKLILRRYLKTTFVFDILGALPIDLIYTAAVTDYHTTVGFRVVRTFRLFRAVRVVSTLFLPYTLTGYLTPTFVYFVYHVSPMLKAGFFFIGFVHVLTVGWLLVVNDPDRVEYWDGLYLVLYTVSTVGYGDVFVVGRAQRLYCSFMFIIGTLLNGIVISQLSVFLSKADIVTERKDKMRETLAVLSHFGIPETSQAEILSFQNHLLEHNLGSSHESLIAALPKSIQDSLGLFMKIKYISLVPMFASATYECKVALAQYLINIVFQPQQFIIISGEEGKEMYFLGHGVADVISPQGKYLATLLKGNFFGEIALLVDGAKRTASIKALTYCDVFRLEKRDFSAILSKFPMFRDSVKIAMEGRIMDFQNAKKKEEEAKKQKELEQQALSKEEQGSMHSGKDGTDSMKGGNDSVRKSATRSIIRPQSAFGGRDDVPLVDLKPELLSAIETQAREAGDGRQHSNEVTAFKEGSSSSMDGSFGPMAYSTMGLGRGRGGRNSQPGTITSEQRDRARAVAQSFLTSGPSGVMGPAAEMPSWMQQTPTGGSFRVANRSQIQPELPPNMQSQTQDTLRLLLDRMNRMERYLAEQAEGSANTGSFSPRMGARPTEYNEQFESIPRINSMRYGFGGRNGSVEFERPTSGNRRQRQSRRESDAGPNSPGTVPGVPTVSPPSPSERSENDDIPGRPAE